jgi:potassium-transporting ATPase KdpC subunit
MRAFTRQLGPAVLALIVFTVIAGLIYPFVVTGVAQLAWNDKANGSLIKKDGVVVGSSLIGQNFSDPKYFHPRPSAAGTGYDGLSSSFSNLGPTNPDFLATVNDRVAAYREENNLPDTQEVPVDAVTASASGLDPDISVANAKLQATRVAAARGTTVDQVLGLVNQYTTGRTWGFLGEPGVNVLELNLALDGK